AGRVLAVLVPDRVVVARRRRVRLVVRRLEVLVLVRVALDRRVRERAARGGRGLLHVGLLHVRDRDLVLAGRVLRIPAPVAPAVAAEGPGGKRRDAGDDHHGEEAAEDVLKALAAGLAGALGGLALLALLAPALLLFLAAGHASREGSGTRPV